MRHHLKALCLLSASLLAVPTLAVAQQLAYASKTVSMRAGPSRDYPVVATLGSGTAMTIYGCLQGYTWCDVVVGASRGWVYSGNIVYPYLGQNVPVMSYGSTLGLGIVTFSMGNYWDNYYTDYPWYPQRQNWASRPWAGYGSGYGSGYDWRAPSHRAYSKLRRNGCRKRKCGLLHRGCSKLHRKGCRVRRYKAWIAHCHPGKRGGAARTIQTANGTPSDALKA